MRKGWEVKVLDDVCEFQNGFAFKSNTYKPSGLPILRITNIQNDLIDATDLVYFDKRDYKENLEKYKVRNGDLLIAMSGATTGKIGINKSNTEFYLNQRVGNFIPGRTLSKDYLYYFLSTMVEESLRISAGAAQPNLSTEQIKNFKIPIPPLPEQKSIVAILDEAFAAIDQAKTNTQKNLQNAKDLFESYLQNVFENTKTKFEEKTLGEYLDLITYGFTNPMPTATKGPYMVTAKDVKNGIVDYNTARKTTQEAFDKLLTNKSRPQKGDVLLTKDGTLGRVAVVEQANLCINQSVALLRPNNQLDSHYLKQLLSSKFYQKIMIEQAGGATIKHIYITRVDKMKIPVPPFRTQQNIVNDIDLLHLETRKLEMIYQQKLNALDELKKSILQKAFAGELL